MESTIQLNDRAVEVVTSAKRPRALLAAYRFLMRIHCRIWYGFHVRRGDEPCDLSGAILMCNHPTKLDYAMLSCAFPDAVIHPDVPLDAKTYGTRWLRNRVGAVYHERGSSVTEVRHRTEAVRTCLDMGECVLEFPEREPRLYRWQFGELSDRPFFLAAVLDAPIVPVALAPVVTRGLNGIVRRRPGFELRVGKPVWLDRSLRPREAEVRFREDVETQMRDLLTLE